MPTAPKPRVIPLYVEPQNNPNISHQQRMSMNEKLEEKPKEKELPEPLINLQVFSEQKKEKKQPYVQQYAQTMFQPPQTLIQNYPQQYPQQYPIIYPPHINMNPSIIPPMIRTYHLPNLGPTDDHSKVNNIYEDIMPTKYVSTAGITLGERITQHDFVRTILFPQGDGSNMNLEGDESLLEHVKFLELNPYNTYRFSDNPYKGLANDFLIYRSCYPIRHNEQTNQTICAKNSMGVNIRIYKLTEGAYQLHKNEKALYHTYEQWREIAYYEYIKEYIIKKKICPNFTLLYGYYICDNSDINFDKVSSLINKNIIDKSDTIKQTPASYNQQLISNHLANIYQLPKPSIYTDPKQALIDNFVNINSNNYIDYMNKTTKKEETTDINAYTGKVIAAVTESATYNFFGWGSRTYKTEGSVKRMINMGYHPDETWISIIFQIMVSLYVLQKHNIFISNFTLQDNVYIKDVNINGNVTNHWKYKINDIDYYIPNYGFIALIDTNFKDLKQPTTSFIATTQDKHKIDGLIFGDGNTLSESSIKQKTFEMFKTALDPNLFGQDFINNGGSKLPDNVLKFLGKIISKTSSTNTTNDISMYIDEFMGQFMNNRIGTYLKNTEIQNVRRDNFNFKRGEIVVYEEQAELFRFVLFVETKNDQSIIYTKIDHTSKEIIKQTVHVSKLLNYSKAEPIVQQFKLNESNLNEDDLLETYIIN